MQGKNLLFTVSSKIASKVVSAAFKDDFYEKFSLHLSNDEDDDIGMECLMLDQLEEEEQQTKEIKAKKVEKLFSKG